MNLLSCSLVDPQKKLFTKPNRRENRKYLLFGIWKEKKLHTASFYVSRECCGLGDSSMPKEYRSRRLFYKLFNATISNSLVI
jgi:hypothetical protein